MNRIPTGAFKNLPEAMMLCLLSGLLAGCQPQLDNLASSRLEETQTIEDPWFVDSAESAGLDFRYQSGHGEEFLFPEIMGGGVGMLDYDDDGLMDVYCVQGGSIGNGMMNPEMNRLFRNLGGGKFSDVTVSTGTGDTGYGMGCTVGDYDNDGDPDIYVTNLGPNVLLRNNGDGSFTDVSKDSGTAIASWSTSASFAHMNEDPFPDLVIANYVDWDPEEEKQCTSRRGTPDYCSPMNYPNAHVDSLLLNNGDGSFRDATDFSGLGDLPGNGLGVVCRDFNLDGKQDIYIANDGMPNRLWINLGEGKFQDEALRRGCAVNHLGMTEAGMGVIALDIDRNSFPDLFMTHLEGESNTLYLNENGYFEDSMNPDGPGFPSLPYTGFGAAIADFNHDRHLDLYVTNGKVKLNDNQTDPVSKYAEQDLLLEGTGLVGFRTHFPITAGNKKFIRCGRGMARGDLDNDGDLDLIIINRDAPAQFLLNETEKSEDWMILDVRERNGSPAIGAQIVVETNSDVLRSEVHFSGSYCSSNDPRLHFVITRNASIRETRITWRDGTTRIVKGIQGRKIHRIQRAL